MASIVGLGPQSDLYGSQSFHDPVTPVHKNENYFLSHICILPPPQKITDKKCFSSSNQCDKTFFLVRDKHHQEIKYVTSVTMNEIKSWPKECHSKTESQCFTVKCTARFCLYHVVQKYIVMRMPWRVVGVPQLNAVFFSDHRHSSFPRMKSTSQNNSQRTMAIRAVQFVGSQNEQQSPWLWLFPIRPFWPIQSSTVR